MQESAKSQKPLVESCLIWGIAMDIGKERNRIALERISFHLGEAKRFCNQLDLSGLAPPEQSKWDNKMKICKDAIEFTMESVQKLSKLLE